ncbi:MAG TPA: zinc transporter ZntB [Alphaproteobacteria bacterium]|nr:zinc transporter ZntB [Alphaproteobacteria bacterium]
MEQQQDRGDHDDGLVHAMRLDGAGGSMALDWQGLAAWRPGDGPLWVHLDRTVANTRRWLERDSGLEPLVVEALLQEETRPRCESFTNGLVVILRGVNLNPGADPDDMISARIWIDGERIITTRSFRLMAIQDVRERLQAGQGPADVAELMVAIADRLIARMGPVIDGLDDRVDGLEEELLERESREIRHELLELRRIAIALRRYLAPQREAISRLQIEERPWLTARHRLRLREVNDRLLRYVEDLDALRERAAVIQDELTNRLSERMNRTMYMLTLVATIMLPLGFITGLLGVNVGGIPGAEDPYAFAVLCAMLVALVAGQVWLFRRLRWL